MMRSPLIRFLITPDQDAGSIWSSTGSSIVSGVAGAVVASVFSASGVASVSGVGGQDSSSVFSASGSSVVSGVGDSSATVDGILSASGSATSLFISEALSDSVLSSDGVASTSFVAQAVIDAVLSSDGQATSTWVGDFTVGGESVGSSLGTSASNFVGSSISEVTFGSSGIASTDWVSAAVFDATFSASGSGLVNGVGSSSQGSQWASSGISTASFVAESIAESVLVSSGQATSNWVGSASGIISAQWSASGSSVSDWRSPDTFEDAVWNSPGSSTAFGVSGFVCDQPAEPISCTDKKFRGIHKRSLRTIYRMFGENVEYHSILSGVGQYCGIFSTEPEFSPDGYATSIQEDEVIYFFRREELKDPQPGDYIIDEGQRYDVLRRERKGRFEWLLVVREILE